MNEVAQEHSLWKQCLYTGTWICVLIVRVQIYAYNMGIWRLADMIVLRKPHVFGQNSRRYCVIEVDCP